MKYFILLLFISCTQFSLKRELSSNLSEYNNKYDHIYFGPEFEINSFKKAFKNFFDQDALRKIFPKSTNIASLADSVVLKFIHKVYLILEVEDYGFKILNECGAENMDCIDLKAQSFASHLRGELEKESNKFSLLESKFLEQSNVDFREVLKLLENEKENSKNSVLLKYFLSKENYDSLKNMSFHLDGADEIVEFTSTKAISYSETLSVYERMNHLFLFDGIHLHMSSDQWIDLIDNSHLVEEFKRLKYIEHTDAYLSESTPAVALTREAMSRHSTEAWDSMFAPLDMRSMVRLIVGTEENINGSENRLEDRHIISVEDFKQSVAQADALFNKNKNADDFKYIKSFYNNLLTIKVENPEQFRRLGIFHDFLIYGESPYFEAALDDLLDNEDALSKFTKNAKTFEGLSQSNFPELSDKFIVDLKLLNFLKRSKHVQLNNLAGTILKSHRLFISIAYFKLFELPFGKETGKKQITYLLGKARGTIENFLEVFKDEPLAKKIASTWYHTVSDRVSNDPFISSQFHKFFDDIDFLKFSEIEIDCFLYLEI